jgi:deazaflavin-dependent oxidoreductase (nitroreductase family)
MWVAPFLTIPFGANVRLHTSSVQLPKVGALKGVNWHPHGRDEMKRQIVHTLQKYVLNPPIKLLFAMNVAPPGYALLETTGCKTGKVRRTPVGDGWIGYQFWLVAEHGMNAGYVCNLVRHPRVRVKLRKKLGAQWHAGTAHVLPDDNPRERQRWLAGQLPSSVANAAAVRFFGTELLTVRIDLDG